MNKNREKTTPQILPEVYILFESLLYHDGHPTRIQVTKASNWITWDKMAMARAVAEERRGPCGTSYWLFDNICLQHSRSIVQRGWFYQWTRSPDSFSLETRLF